MLKLRTIRRVKTECKLCQPRWTDNLDPVPSTTPRGRKQSSARPDILPHSLSLSLLFVCLCLSSLSLSVSPHPQEAKVRFNYPLEIKLWTQLFLFFLLTFSYVTSNSASNEVDICNLGVLLGRKKRGEGGGERTLRSFRFQRGRLS